MVRSTSAEWIPAEVSRMNAARRLLAPRYSVVASASRMVCSRQPGVDGAVLSTIEHLFIARYHEQVFNSPVSKKADVRDLRAEPSPG